MAEKLNINAGTTALGKKILDIHQRSDYQKVNTYKEGLCFNCLKNSAVGATVSDICGDCSGKRGRETILVSIKEIYYGLCHFCGKYKFNMEQINCRLCQSCNKRVSNVFKEYNRKGGMYGADPFWVHQRKKNGKDWKFIFENGRGNPR